MKWAIIITLFVVFDLVLAVILIRFVARGGWAPLQQRFPAAEPAPDAVTRRFQSYRVGLLSLGFAVHTAVDDAFLHLTPARFLRTLGLRPVSIPWDRIAITGRSRGHRMKASVDGIGIEGPAWCLGLAEPETDSRPDREFPSAR